MLYAYVKLADLVPVPTVCILRFPDLTQDVHHRIFRKARDIVKICLRTASVGMHIVEQTRKLGCTHSILIDVLEQKRWKVPLFGNLTHHHINGLVLQQRDILSVAKKPQVAESSPASVPDLILFAAEALCVQPVVGFL